MFCLPRPRPRVGRQCSRWRVLLRPPRFASALPPVPTLDPQRRHCPWHLWFPPARPPPHPPRRLPPRPGPGAERPERVSARISERRGHFKAIIPKYLSEPNLRPETNHAPTCRRQPAPRPCSPPPTLDGDRSPCQSRRVRGPITCPEQDQKSLTGYVLYYGF